jgi:hypothetical protein
MIHAVSSTAEALGPVAPILRAYSRASAWSGCVANEQVEHARIHVRPIRVGAPRYGSAQGHRSEDPRAVRSGSRGATRLLVLLVVSPFVVVGSLISAGVGAAAAVGLLLIAAFAFLSRVLHHTLNALDVRKREDAESCGDGKDFSGQTETVSQRVFNQSV